MFSIMFAALSAEDQDFIQQLYDKYGKKMYAYAYKIFHNQYDAENAVSDAMVNIIKHIDKFEGATPDDIKSKMMINIRTIVKNASIDVYNKNKEIIVHERDFYYTDDDDELNFIDVEDINYDLEDIVITSEDYHKVNAAILKLPQYMKDTIDLVYAQGFSCHEAAEFLGIKENAVKARLFKARERLKNLLGDDFNG